MAQISPILFSKEIASQLFGDNNFYTRGTKDVAAANVNSVQIPIAGDIDEAVIGAPVHPTQYTERTDTFKSYDLTQIYIKPISITREEDIVLSYSKQNDVVTQMANKLAKKLADYTANAWGTASGNANFVLTTGSARVTSLVGATGNRKAIALADLINVRKMFMKQDLMSLDGIIGVVTPDMYMDLLNIDQFRDYDKTGQTSKLINGSVGQILGMEIIVRNNNTLGSIGLHYVANGATKKANGTVATTDSPAALFFSPRLVRYVESFPQVFIKRDDPDWYGAIKMSSIVRFGATQLRADGVGVVSLIEGT